MTTRNVENSALGQNYEPLEMANENQSKFIVFKYLKCTTLLIAFLVLLCIFFGGLILYYTTYSTEYTIYTCDVVGNESKLTVFGNYIKISDVLQKSTDCSKSLISTLVVFASKTIVFDVDIQRMDTNLMRLELLVLVAPKWTIVSEESLIVDLSGQNGSNLTPESTAVVRKDVDKNVSRGKDGLPGRPGGSFVGIYSESECSYSPCVIKFIVRGGNGEDGGNGQDGVHGSIGRNASFYDFPAASDVQEDIVVLRTTEGKSVETFSPGSLLKGRVMPDGLLTMRDREMYGRGTEWHTVVGLAGGPGGKGGNGGNAGAGGVTGNVTILKLSNKASGGQLRVEVVEGDGEAGKPGKGGTGGKQGGRGDNLSCINVIIGHIVWETHSCYASSYNCTGRLCPKPGKASNGRPGEIGAALKRVVTPNIPTLITSYKIAFLQQQNSASGGENSFVPLLESSQHILSFYTPESFAHELLTTYKNIQEIDRNQNLTLRTAVESLSARMKAYAFGLYNEQITNGIRDLEIIKLDMIQTFALSMMRVENNPNEINMSGVELAQEGFKNKSVITALNFISVARDKLRKLEKIFYSIHLQYANDYLGKDSSCSDTLNKTMHPVYDSTFFGRQFLLSDATEALFDLLQEITNNDEYHGMTTVITEEFPHFIAISNYTRALKIYLDHPLGDVVDKHCLAFLSFFKFVEDVKVSLEEPSARKKLVGVSRNLNEGNVLQIIQNNGLAHVSQVVEEAVDNRDGQQRNFKSYLVTLLEQAVPWQNVSCVNHNKSMVVYGNYLVLSSIFANDAEVDGDFSSQHCRLTEIEKLLLFSSEIMLIDRNLTRKNSKWTALKQVSIIAPKWIISGTKTDLHYKESIILDLRGSNGASANNAPACDGIGVYNSGEDGRDGSSGGDGLDFFGIYSEFISTPQLQIKLDGGDGGNGGNGGKGCDGLPGLNASLSNFKKGGGRYDPQFPPFSEQELAQPDGAFYIERITKNGTLTLNYTISHWATATGFTGGPGSNGGNGGNAGRGGEPGTFKLLQISPFPNNSKPVQVQVSQKKGSDGKPGFGGPGGREGPRGDNYSCQDIPFDDKEWVNCYPSNNFRTELYRRFKNGRSGEDGGTISKISREIETLNLTSVIGNYLNKFDSLEKNAFISSLRDILKTA